MHEAMKSNSRNEVAIVLDLHSVDSQLMTPPSDSHFSPDKSKSSTGSGLTKLSGGSGSGSYIPNWSDFFPPPPNCPPSDSESAMNTPRVPRNSGYQVKALYYY